MIIRVISTQCLAELQDRAISMSSLKFLQVHKCTTKRVHPTWANLSTPFEVRRATFKARLLCGVYILQSTRASFNQFKVDPTCPLCSSGPEDSSHFLLSCKALHDTRRKHILRLLDLHPSFTVADILDSSALSVDLCVQFEYESSKLVHKLHEARSHLII